MDWCVVAEFSQVNHNPVAILNGDRSKQIVKITTKSRDNIKLTAAGSSDPDDNKISSSWMIYREASTSSNGVKLTQPYSPPRPCKLFSAPCHPAKLSVEEPKWRLKSDRSVVFPGAKTALGQAIPSHKIRVQQTVISLFIIIIAKSQER